MRKNIFYLLRIPIVVFIVMVFLFSAVYSQTINVKDYIKEKFPSVFSFYLSSLEDLDSYEKEFIDLLEKLPKEEQEYYAKEVYKNGFSLELLEKLKKGETFVVKTKEKPKEEVTEEGVTLTPTPSPTATLTPAGPTQTPFPAPAAGMGNVACKVLWNDQPVPDAEVKLCAKLNIFSGCEGLELSGTTDQEGCYLFANVPPGKYVFLVRIPGEKNWTYRAKFMNPIKETVKEGETLIVKERSTIKSNLKLSYPMDKADIETTTPILEWDAYPKATYYEVAFQYETLDVYLLSGDRGRTEEPKLDVSKMLPKPLQPGKYVWRVKAYNAHHTQIAKSRHDYHFVVIGQPPLFKLLSPADGEVVRTMPLTLGWDAWPGTTYYKVYLVQDKPKRETILSFVKTWENSHTITLEPGEYHWGIDAYDANDESIGKGEGLPLPHFTVK